jgi:hypothetical protein
MKLLRIILDPDPRSGGPIEGTRRFGAVWAQHGHQQDLLTLDAPGETFLTDYPGKIFGMGPPRTRNPLHKYRYSPKMVTWLREHASEYDAVLVSGLWRYMTMGAGKALIGSKTLLRPSAWHARSLVQEDLPAQALGQATRGLLPKAG